MGRDWLKIVDERKAKERNSFGKMLYILFCNDKHHYLRPHFKIKKINKNHILSSADVLIRGKI